MGSSFSLIEIMRVLYDDVATHFPDKPNYAQRDRIILSKGHGVLAQAVLLADAGYFPLGELDKFCQKDSIIGGHPSPDHMPGIECHTGALGHGLSLGVGMALAAKIRKQTHRIFVICGDGEIQEGSVWEAAMSAAKHKLDNLTLIIDHNKLQSAGFVYDIQPLGNLKKKFESFGFMAIEANGHNVKELQQVLANNPWWVQKLAKGVIVDSDAPWVPVEDKPKCIIAHTVKGKGISFAENNPMFHYKGQIDDKLMGEMEAALGYQV